ncbi:hypothetical protein GUJ93_ZPchr0007g4417 [Zizania palustris]|uniref:CCHC-type domain-containing protein n=1 Tax=Zizania palustris TaxID=103762 RepID=A0A8J5VNU6_ZIZPA|nr:hypothetical protein GUJ93_ZPchr0007g4417 [Zizania palustris]
MNHIEKLRGDNYASWREGLLIALAILDVDYSLQEACPVQPTEPVIRTGEAADAFAARQLDFAPIRMKYDIAYEKWKHSNRKCLMIIKNSLLEPIRSSIPDCETATQYLKKIDAQFAGSSKAACASTIKRFINEKYRGGGVRDHILRMSNWAASLKTMECALTETFIVHVIMSSLSKDFEHFVINYNSLPEVWTFEKLVSNCVQEEDRIKEARGSDSVHQIQDKGKKQFTPKKNTKTFKKKGKAPKDSDVPQGVCRHCKKEGHHMKDCVEFLKWMHKHGIRYDENFGKKRKNN